MKPNTDAASGEKTIEDFEGFKFPHDLIPQNRGYQYARFVCVNCKRTMDGQYDDCLVAELRAEVERLRGTLETIRNMEVYLGGGHRSFDWQYYKEKFSDAIKRAAKALEGAKENNE